MSSYVDILGLAFLGLIVVTAAAFALEFGAGIAARRRHRRRSR